MIKTTVSEIVFHTAKGGLSVYWAIMIGIIIVSAYMVGGLVPKRIVPPVKGQKMSFNSPHFTDTYASLQMRSLSFQGCKGLPAVLFLLDSSQSMRQNQAGSTKRKIDTLKSALMVFSTKIADDALVGIATYSDSSGNDPKLRLPIGKIGEHRSDYKRVVTNLDASGLTYMKDGFEEARDVLKKEVNNYKGYEFSVIVIANSIPRTAACLTDPRQNACSCKGGNNCLATDQDPLTSPNVVQELKDMGVKVYTITLGDVTTSDEPFVNELIEMLKESASEPKSRFAVTTPGTDKLPEILAAIGDNLCLIDAQSPSFPITRSLDQSQ